MGAGVGDRKRGTLDIGDEFSSPFDAAMERAEFVKSAKAKKERYARQVL